ncbi:MAG: hypothetical protein CMI96_01925 [Pelagibacteraceae bacterium]|nr:hypothetical protein [Pelagibacteraceae bacterium]|tara:strand:- start:9371 stop:9787 length:417 start_codon:yes stop_codon:yes gene_type:complete
MIVFNLKCQTCSLIFEGWFDSNKDFVKQKKNKIINCPSCNSQFIKKTLVAPNISKKSNSKDKNIKKSLATNISNLKKIVEKNFDYVGDEFTKEAKKIKYGETKERPIYGEATIEETKELIDEEINVVPLPFAPTKKTN